MKYDKPLIAIIIGCISTIAYEIFTQLLILFGIGKYSLYQLDSLIVTINRPSEIMGAIVSFVIGGLGGVLFYLALKKLGTEYIMVKASIFSLLTWLALEVVFTAIIEGKTIDIRPMSDYYSKMLGSIIFGITLGLSFKRFLFKKIVS